MKRIVIIGATSGIGKELALLYAAEGHRVGITGRRQAFLDNVEQRFPKQICTACFDAAGEQNIQALDRLIELLGGMDLFIYNAGGGQPSETFELETELATTRINVIGCVALTGHAFLYFLGKGSGQIAITSSVAALRGNSRAPAYSASKAFVSNYAEGLNIKAKRLNKQVVITDIRPGFVDTKAAGAERRFWVAPVAKAARQIKRAIGGKKRVAYISRRWWMVAQLMKWLPYPLLRRVL